VAESRSEGVARFRKKAAALRADADFAESHGDQEGAASLRGSAAGWDTDAANIACHGNWMPCKH
jgi:hypothetical protein